MEKYFKVISDGYIIAVSKGETGQTEISKEEYKEIMGIIKSVPIAPSGYYYKLRVDLTWELLEIPVEAE